MRYEQCDVAVIGGGPAGLAAAAAAAAEGVSVCLFEREQRPGGILKQCIHDGFGLMRYGEKLSGPEYAFREISRFRESGAALRLETFLNSVEKTNNGFRLTLVDCEGILKYDVRALITACGCRERTDRQIGLQGSRPAGIFTAGQVQALMNIDGRMPARRCVILGSGDIGLIMARRLALEGAEVAGVYEIKSEPAGLSRNIAQCLNDFSIPLYLNSTVVSAVGKDRLEGVYTVRTDENFKPVAGSEQFVPCDTLILSVGLIPENDVFESLGWETDPMTGGPRVDSRGMTSAEGVFSCGNSLYVSDLADYVSQSGETAGKAAAAWVRGEREDRTAAVIAGNGIASLVPQRIVFGRGNEEAVFYFRSRSTIRNARLSITADGKEILSRSLATVRPPEMEKIVIPRSAIDKSAQTICFSLDSGEDSGEESGFFVTDEKVCIECPKGCRLRMGKDTEGNPILAGYSCPKGKRYGEEELKHPRRVLTTTVKTVFPDCPRLPVKTDGGIPIEFLKEAIHQAASVLVREKTIPGTVLADNFGGWGVRLIAAAATHPQEVLYETRK